MTSQSIPRPLIWKSADGSYRLEELVCPDHVREAGTDLQNCLADISNRERVSGPRRRRARPRGPASSFYNYNIAARRIRVFVFTDNVKCLAAISLGYGCFGPSIGQIQGWHNHRINGTEPYFLHLVLALAKLDHYIGRVMWRPDQIGRPKAVMYNYPFDLKMLEQQFQVLKADCQKLSAKVGLPPEFSLHAWLAKMIEARHPFYLVERLMRRTYRDLRPITGNELYLAELILALQPFHEIPKSFYDKPDRPELRIDESLKTEKLRRRFS